MKTFKVTTDIKAVTEPDGRYATNSVMLAAGEGTVFAYATNGRAAALAVYDSSSEPDGLVDSVPADCVPEGTAKGVKVSVGNGEVTVHNGESRALKYEPVDRLPPYAFGNRFAVMAKVAEPKRVLSISADDLHKLARAICDKGEDKSLTVSVMIPDNSIDAGPLMVIGDKGIGLIMPCTSDRLGECVARFNRIKDAANAVFERGSESE